MPPTAFISGPLAPAPTYFTTHYIPALARAITAGHNFILGPSAGVDTLALTYLLAQIPASRITIYLASNQTHLRKRYGDFEGGGGRVVVVDKAGHTARDEACTRASHYDILTYPTVEEQRVEYGVGYRERVSGTQKNEIRRRGGVGLVWNVEEAVGVVERTEIVVDETARRRKGLERKVREARRLQERSDAGERLEVNQVRKISALEGWERELSALSTDSMTN